MAKVPASIRYKNPGAMWGSALAKKWGATNSIKLNDGTGQGNNIAVFPTYVQGICAQLDLWRTSKHYKNKKFKDAIRVWSGGNHVESYIKFVLQRVPGMTRNTVMDDAFWQSPMGVAFLKAQAWHEAGRKYPAPDADWIEAQRRVFAGEVPAGSNVAPDVIPANDASIEDVQIWLKQVGYVEVGEADGKVGSRTTAAIAAFKKDWNQPGLPVIDDTLKAVLQKAVADNWKRPIAPARAGATSDELAPKLPEVKAAQSASFWAKVQGWWSAVFGGVTATGVVTNLMTAKETVDPIKSWFGDAVPYGLAAGFVIIVVVIAIMLARKTSGAATDAAEASTTAYQEGARV